MRSKILHKMGASINCAIVCEESWMYLCHREILCNSLSDCNNPVFGELKTAVQKACSILWNHYYTQQLFTWTTASSRFSFHALGHGNTNLWLASKSTTAIQQLLVTVRQGQDVHSQASMALFWMTVMLPIPSCWYCSSSRCSCLLPWRIICSPQTTAAEIQV